MNKTNSTKHNFFAVTIISFLVSYSLILVLLIGFFVIPNLSNYFTEAKAFILMTCVFVGTILLFRNTFLRKIALIISVWILSVLGFIKLAFYSMFNVKLSSSSLYLFFESNLGETSEFLNNYINFKVILLFFAFFLFPILLSFSRKFKLIIYKYINNFLLPISIKILLGFLILLTLFVIKNFFPDQSLVFVFQESLKDYKDMKANMKTDLAQEINLNLNISTTSNSLQTGVVIIGESTSSWHMQLYGYNRETNPLLTEIKDELILFEDVIAPSVMTIRSLKKALTLESFTEPKIKNNFSVIQLANQANFETYWLSNQQPVGYTESVPTLIANAANVKEYISTDSYKYTIYDESLLPSLEKALSSKKHKKIIFIHLIGTHNTYNKRYPSEFNFFAGENEKTKFKTENSITLVNEYDNAVRYNDSIVREIIEKVRKKDESSFVIYFSDHGDDVFDTIEFAGHHGSKASKPMYEVPMIAWFSGKFKKDSLFLPNIKKPYHLEDFIYSFSDLIDADFERYDSSRSIFSKSFKTKKRLIKNNVDYDSWK